MTYTVRCGNVLHEGRIFRRGEKVFLNDEMAAGLVRSGIIECTDPKIEEPVEEVSEEIEEPVEKSTPKTKGKRAKAKVSEDSDLPSVNLKELVEK